MRIGVQNLQERRGKEGTCTCKRLQAVYPSAGEYYGNAVFLQNCPVFANFTHIFQNVLAEAPSARRHTYDFPKNVSRVMCGYQE